MKAYGSGSGGEQSETVPLKVPPFSDSTLHPMQHLFWASLMPLQESKQHMVRSLAAAGILYPIHKGAVCFCTRPSTVAFKPLAAESSWIFALVTLGFCATVKDAHET